MRSISLLLLILLITQAATFAQEPVSVRIAMNAPASFDPVHISRFDLPARDMAENLFVGLTRLNARAGQIEPALAESWRVSEDNLTWTFELRDDVQWVKYNPESNEVEAVRPVTAQDVVFAIHRGCDPNRPSPVTSNLYIIAGCRSFASANTLENLDPDRTIGVFAIDDTTLEIRLLFPAAFFSTMVSLPEFRPLPAELVNDANGNWLRPDTIVTSGAWAVSEWVEGSHIKLVRNPLWNGEFEGNLDEVEVRFDLAAEVLGSELSAGTLDVARVTPATSSSLPQDLLHSADGTTLLLLGYSFGNVDAEGLPVLSPLDNPDVRRALALAIDRDQLATQVFSTEAASTTHFTPRSVIAAPSSPGAAFDPTTATSLLQNAGYPNCVGFGTLSFAISQDQDELAVAQNMITQWQTNLGCAPEVFQIIQLSRQEVLDSAHRTVDVVEDIRYPMWLITWSADYPDAQAWVSDALHCDYGYLRVGRACDQVDEVMNLAGISTDLRSRFTSYNQVETLLFGTTGSFPVVPLVMRQQWWAQQPNLQGVASYGQFQFDRWLIGNN